ncbi:MAG: L,D-transpeptidase family protein [Chloroflexi bacterium]|nr:L,D-transpeptidase family protein [Chloroflexota bacterium]
MIGTTLVRRPFSSAETSVLTSRLLLGGLTLLTALVGILVAVTIVAAVVPHEVAINLPDGVADVQPAAEIRATVSGFGATFESASLVEVTIAPDGRTGVEHEVPARAELTRVGRWPDESELAIRPAEGTFRPDAMYRLTVRGTAFAPTVLGPGRIPIEREIRFSTARSPRPFGLAPQYRLKWNEPLRITWDTPLDHVSFDVSPPVAFRGWIDTTDRRQSFLAVDEPADGTTYQIRVVVAHGTNGIPTQRPIVTTATYPSRLRLDDVEDPRIVELGNPFTLRFSAPVDRVALEVSPAVASSVQVDRRDPRAIDVTLDQLSQGTTYTVTVREAVSRDGAPLDGQPIVHVKTPDALAVEALDMGESGPRVSTKARPTLVFSQPIRDRRRAASALALDPPVAGRWEWLDDRHVRFNPLRALPFNTEVTVKVRAGPDGPRSTSGSYIDGSLALAFLTESDKLIDVDVTHQMMTLYQEGRVVRTFSIATGVPGADTPLGEFAVEYKMPVARFRGTNVSGSTYDIPDVRWVLAFMGDYTIHGAYWRANFGAPGSNGCVSLTDADAKTLFDWAPEGTRITIHY